MDAAHNPAGAKASAQAVLESFNLSSLVIVAGILAEKDAVGILSELREVLGDVVSGICLTQSSSPRAIPAEELVQDAVDAGFPDEAIQVEPGLDNAIEWAVAKAEENEDLAGGVLIIGSITVVAEARTLLGK